MKNDFLVAMTQLSSEKNLPKETVLQAIEQALISAGKRNVRGGTNISATIDAASGKMKILGQKTVVEMVHDPRVEITLDEARQFDPMIEMGGMVSVEWTTEDFGRIDIMTAKQVFLQRIREAERDTLYNAFAGREGEIIQGMVQSIEPQGLTINLGKVEASLPRGEMIPTERYRHNQKIRAYIAEVNKTARGPQIILSRTHRNFLKRLFEFEVPEIYNGLVEIKAIAREPGSRSKMAVVAVQDGIDPIGACVGQRGVRIQAVTKELGGERVDIIEWSADPSRFIANALQPAQVLNVKLREDENGDRVAQVTVEDKALSLAIGKEGQNARLAAKLTGVRIDIKKLTEVQEEAARLEAEQAAQAAQAAVLAAVETAPIAEAEPPTPVTEAVAPEPATQVPVATTTPAPVDAARIAIESAEEEPEQSFAEALEAFEADAEEDEDEEGLSPEEKAKRKAAKGKRQTLVFDEELGKVVAKRKRKSSRSQDWEEIDE